LRYRSCRAAPWQTLPGRARGPGCRGGACPRAGCRPIRGGLGRSRPRRRRGIGEVHLSGLPPQLLAPGPPLSGQPAPIGYLIYSRRRPTARCDHAGAPTVIRQAQTPAIQLLQPFVATRKPLRLARASRAALVDLTRTHPPPHNPVMAVKSMQWAITQCGNSTMAADSDRRILAHRRQPLRLCLGTQIIHSGARLSLAAAGFCICLHHSVVRDAPGRRARLAGHRRTAGYPPAGRVRGVCQPWPTAPKPRPALAVVCTAGLAALHDMEPWHGIDIADLDSAHSLTASPTAARLREAA